MNGPRYLCPPVHGVRAAVTGQELPSTTTREPARGPTWTRSAGRTGLAARSTCRDPIWRTEGKYARRRAIRAAAAALTVAAARGGAAAAGVERLWIAACCGWASYPMPAIMRQEHCKWRDGASPDWHHTAGVCQRAHRPPLAPSSAGLAGQRGEHSQQSAAAVQRWRQHLRSGRRRRCTTPLHAAATAVAAQATAHSGGSCRRTPLAWYRCPGAATRWPSLSKNRPPLRIWGRPRSMRSAARRRDSRGRERGEAPAGSGPAECGGRTRGSRSPACRPASLPAYLPVMHPAQPSARFTCHPQHATPRHKLSPTHLHPPG